MEFRGFCAMMGGVDEEARERAIADLKDLTARALPYSKDEWAGLGTVFTVVFTAQIFGLGWWSVPIGVAAGVLVTIVLHRARKPAGHWHGPRGELHTCLLPSMPKRCPAGIIYRCPACAKEWLWIPR